MTSPMTDSGASFHTSSNTAIKKKSVAFVNADIVEFEPTVWTASVTSGGVPLGMSITERKRSRRRLDSYESERKQGGRITRQEYMEEGYLEPEEREEILCTVGHRSLSFDLAEHEVMQINEERRESNENDAKYQIGLGEADLIYCDPFEDENDMEIEHVEEFDVNHDGTDAALHLTKHFNKESHVPMVFDQPSQIVTEAA